MSVSGLVEQMIILLFFMVVGFVTYKTGILDADGNKKFSRLLLYVTQPAMILASALNSEANFTPADVGRMLLYACAMYALLILLAYGLSPLFRVSPARKKVFRFMTIFGNVAFMGFPVIAAVYGREAILIASIYCIPFNVLSYSVGVLMISGEENSKLDLKLMANPAMFATLLSLLIIFFKIQLPGFIVSAVDTLGAVTVPGAMIVIGVTIGSASLKQVLLDGYTYLLCFIKLIVSPVVVWFVCRLFVHDTMLLGILVVLSAMPVAAVSTMMSIEYGGDSETASRGVLLSTIMAVVTAPLMTYLLLM